MINENEFKKTEYYLYNYKNIDNIIKSIEVELIDSVCVSSYEWLNGINNDRARTVENQAIRIIENKRIQELKKIKILFTQLFNRIHLKNRRLYNFIKLKYIDKNNREEIQQKLNIKIESQRDITNKVVSFIFLYLKNNNLNT